MSDTAILFDPFTGDEEIEYVPQDEPSVSCALMAWRNQHIHPEGALGGRRTEGHVESAGSSLFNTPPKLCSPPVSAFLSFLSCGAQTLSDSQADAPEPASHPEGALGGRVTTGHVKFEGSSLVNTPPKLCYPPIASPFPIVSSAHPLNNLQIDTSVTSIVHLEGARGGRMTNGAIKSLGDPLFNTPPEVSHSLPPSISTFAPPNGLSPPNHSSEHPQTSANIVTQLCNKPGIPFDKGMPEPDPPPSSLPNSEGTAAGGDSSSSAQEALLHSPTSNNSGSAREALLYNRSSRSAQARALLKRTATEDGSSPLRCARARPKVPPYRRRASGGVSKLPTWRTRESGTVRDAHSSKFCWKVSYKHISFPLPLPPYAIPDMDHEDTKDKAQPPETVVFCLRRVLKKPPKDPTKS